MWIFLKCGCGQALTAKWDKEQKNIKEVLCCSDKLSAYKSFRGRSDYMKPKMKKADEQYNALDGKLEQLLESYFIDIHTELFEIV